MALCKRDEIRLKAVIARLEALVDPDSDVCLVAADHKLAVRPFITSWVTPLLRGVLEGTPREHYVDGEAERYVARMKEK